MDVVGWVAVVLIAAVVIGGVAVGVVIPSGCPALHEDPPNVEGQE